MAPDQPSRHRAEGRERVVGGPGSAGRAGQPTAAGRSRRAPRAGPAAAPLAIVLVGLVASAGCQNVDEPATAHQIGAAAATTNAADYPSLHTVPPRPQLSYSVQQQRAIVDGLIADRVNARYTDRVVRYRTGRSSLPPPPAPPPVLAAAEPEAPAGPTMPPGAPGAADPSQPETFDDAGGLVDPGDSGNDTLSNFVDDLVRDTADQPPAAGSDAEGEDSDGSRWFDWLGDLFGQAEGPGAPAAADRPAAEPPAAGAPAAGPADARAPVGAGAPPEAEAALTALVAETLPAFQPAPNLQPAMAPGRAAGPQAAADGDPIGATLAAAEGGAPAEPVGIAIGDGEVAIEVEAPAAARPAAATSIAADPPAASIAADPPAASTSAVRTAAVTAATGTLSAGGVAFAPGSAELPIGIGPQLEQVLAMARTRGALIRIVGEGDAAALALDRARAVAIALVRLGARAGELEMTLAPDATADQARLLLALPAAR